MVSHIDDDHISFANLVMVPAGQKSRKFDAGDGLLLTVIGPDEERVRALQEEWDRQIDKLGVAKVAEFADQSVFNLSSITVLATFKKKTMLLTGDARGQDEFTIHLTHGRLPEDPDPNKLLDFFRKEKKAGKQYKTAIREPDALGIAVDLLA